MAKKIEANIKQSFSLVKNDIIRLQKDMFTIAQNQKKISEAVAKLRESDLLLYQKIKEMTSKKPAKVKLLEHKKKKKVKKKK
jgi:septation ring formation regulator EzrA